MYIYILFRFEDLQNIETFPKQPYPSAPGRRYAFTFNVYPYFDPNLQLVRGDSQNIFHFDAS